MFTQWSKGAVFAMSLFGILLFTLTANVVFEPVLTSTAWAAEDQSQRQTETETTEESRAAKDKLSGAADGATGFIGGIIGWIKGVTNSINEMWGMENGGGMATAVNALFYLFLIAIFFFVGKMAFNIVKDSLGGKVDERYQKPTFRKK